MSNIPNLVLKIFKIKILDKEYKNKPIILSFQVDSQKFVTEQLQEKDSFNLRREFVFELQSNSTVPVNKDNKYKTLTISALEIQWLLFQNQIAKISIQIPLKNQESEKEWYFLKNEKHENIYSILIQFKIKGLNSNGNKPECKLVSDISFCSPICKQRSSINLFNLKNLSFMNMNKTTNEIPLNINDLNDDNDNNQNFIPPNLEQIESLIHKSETFLNDLDSKIAAQETKNQKNFKINSMNEKLLLENNKKYNQKNESCLKTKMLYENKSINFNNKFCQFEKENKLLSLMNDLNDINKQNFNTLNSIYQTNDLLLQNYEQEILRKKEKKKIEKITKSTSYILKKNNHQKSYSNNQCSQSKNKTKKNLSQDLVSITITSNEKLSKRLSKNLGSKNKDKLGRNDKKNVIYQSHNINCAVRPLKHIKDSKSISTKISSNSNSYTSVLAQNNNNHNNGLSNSNSYTSSNKKSSSSTLPVSASTVKKTKENSQHKRGNNKSTLANSSRRLSLKNTLSIPMSNIQINLNSVLSMDSKRKLSNKNELRRPIQNLKEKILEDKETVIKNINILKTSNKKKGVFSTLAKKSNNNNIYNKKPLSNNYHSNKSVSNNNEIVNTNSTVNASQNSISIGALSHNSPGFLSNKIFTRKKTTKN